MHDAILRRGIFTSSSPGRGRENETRTTHGGNGGGGGGGVALQCRRSWLKRHAVGKLERKSERERISG